MMHGQKNIKTGNVRTRRVRVTPVTVERQ